MPTLYISSFADAARTGAPGRVSITRFLPQWWDGPHYAPLVPHWKFRSVPRDRYEDLYPRSWRRSTRGRSWRILFGWWIASPLRCYVATIAAVRPSINHGVTIFTLYRGFSTS